ncbi:ectopic P granules protein 5 homolog [Cylas formicarius]|uniref:ectopic P granules protein 5 homolog n=1 Tax=Cylas formicarius TaxID=197179 RepID=UPI002958CE1B|nr:ectopic P granules protein 5 homolog [Cylas formicarius]
MEAVKSKQKLKKKKRETQKAEILGENAIEKALSESLEPQSFPDPAGNGTNIVPASSPNVFVQKSDNILATNETIEKSDDDLRGRSTQTSMEKFLDMNKQILKTVDDIGVIVSSCGPKSGETRRDVEATALLNTNRIILKTVEDSDVYNKPSEQLKQFPYQRPEIKPYTEQQLSALYHNSELDSLEQFRSDFLEAELKGLAVKRHHLFELLTNYLKVREKITGNDLELEQIRKEYRHLQNELWTIESAEVSGRAECDDGQIVTATHAYRKSIFHRSIFQSVVRILGNVRQLLYDNHVLFSYSAEDLRLQIDLFVHSVIANCVSATGISANTPVSLSVGREPPHLTDRIAEIRLCISILFAFQRRLVRDPTFSDETRAWLKQLVAVLLRVANYQDHLFIINHILRCPAGVGSWASSFVQVPLDIRSGQSPFSSYEVNHLLAILAVILSPVEERENFLNDIAHNKEGATDALWIIVDSDGEEDDQNAGTSLKENDLVSLLNQLPLDDMFRMLLLIGKRDDQDFYDSSLVSEHHLVRFFAFGTILLRLIHRGLQTYNQPRYNQFSKRLSRFIRHVVQYTTDQWEQFSKANKVTDGAMLERIQIEYDAFFLRAIFYLYSSQKLGAWQFLAVVPYNVATIKTLWKIFYFLHNSDEKADDILNPQDSSDYSGLIWERALRVQFEEKLERLEDAEIYYLLNTFANMALARGDRDVDFVRAAVLDLLQVGFISETTRDSCYKSARILLTHLTSKHPHLLSEILASVKDNIDRIKSLALYLYEELPLSVWTLTYNDLEIIAGLLLNSPVASDESKLARMILSRLNWDLLPYEMHCDTALLVLKSVDQELGYLQWGWQTILRLKLHISDKHFKEFGRVQEPERFDILTKGIKEGRPLASFVSVLMTTWGHLIPPICTHGMDQLIQIQNHHKHEAVLFALYQIVPLFMSSQECLVNLEKYQQVLVNLLNADRGYISMAKSLLVGQDTVLQQFGNMIETQIANYRYYELDGPRPLVRLWMNSLVSMPNWNSDGGVLYLLDVLIGNAFFHKDGLEVVYEILRNLHQCGTPTEAGSIFSVLKWVSGVNTSNSLIANSLAPYPWLAYVFLEIEHQEREVRTGLWREILIELSKQKGKINVDHAIKKAAGTVKVSPFTSGWLCIYRWAQQALDTPIDHQLLPLIWQKFFTLFLTRITTSTGASENACVGPKFFDGLVNFAYQKRIKRRLQETVEHYESDDGNCDGDPDAKELRQSCRKLFQAFLLWLDEPGLRENTILHRLPPQYEPGLLTLIVQNDRSPWYQYLDYEKLRRQREACIRTWRVANFREKTNVNRPLLNPGGNSESSDPVERILRRLTSYDAPKPPPDLVQRAPVMPPVDFADKDSMFRSLEPCFKTLKQFAHNHTLKLSEHKALDCSYQELAPQLYRSVLNKVKKKIPCKGRNQTVHCSGAATVVLEMQEARVNERIEHQIEINRNAYESLVAKTLEKDSASLCGASVAIQRAVGALRCRIEADPSSAEMGVRLFYHILSLFDEETTAYPPTRTLFAICLEKLGRSHIYGVEREMPGLLRTILTEPRLACYLAPHFSPANVGTARMLSMYVTICDETDRKCDVVFALLSKFEIDKWLNARQPKLSERTRFIEAVVKGLTVLGYDPPVETLMLHGLYRKHLLMVFEHQFPEHYGEILVRLLNASDGNSESALIAKTVWLDVLNSLSKPARIDPKTSLRDQLRQYAQHQSLLQHQELLDTVELLSRHFTKERLQYGLYGLYPKCRNYMDVYVLLVGMSGHALIVSMLNTHQGTLGDKLCEKIWPYIRDVFAPWLVPYSMHNLKDNMAAWIQQLADDRTVLLPWIPSDSGQARKMLDAFFECVTFVLHTLPTSTSILSYLWQWYVASFAHVSVKDHVLLPVHQLFATFPWHNFWPSVTDLECMLKVVDQYLPDCHSFLGHVFISVPWTNWFGHYADAPVQVKSRIHHCFLNLTVKLINEPKIRANYSEKAKALLVQAETLDWPTLDPVLYQHVMDWLVMSYEASIIFKRDPLDLDCILLRFLATVAGYHATWPEMTPALLAKRQIYVRTVAKLLSIYAGRRKNAIASRQNEIHNVVFDRLNELERVVDTRDEFDTLLREWTAVVNIDGVGVAATQAFVKWIKNKPSDGMALRSLLRTLGLCVDDPKCLAELCEATLTSYFCNVFENCAEPTWQEVVRETTIQSSKRTELEEVLTTSGSVLTLNVMLMQRAQKCTDKEAVLNTCIECIERVKVNESTEPKIPLVWFTILRLALDHCDKDETGSAILLYKFAQILLHMSEDKSGSRWGRGILSAIGMARQECVSVNFRFLCRALGGYILAQLPEMKGHPQTVRRTGNAPCGAGQPGGNTECSKVLMVLDFGQSQGKIKDCAVLALNQIQDPGNSLRNSKAFLWLLLKQFYVKPYLRDIG